MVAVSFSAWWWGSAGGMHMSHRCMNHNMGEFITKDFATHA